MRRGKPELLPLRPVPFAITRRVRAARGLEFQYRKPRATLLRGHLERPGCARGLRITAKELANCADEILRCMCDPLIAGIRCRPWAGAKNESGSMPSPMAKLHSFVRIRSL